jgi:hypothetical protein
MQRVRAVRERFVEVAIDADAQGRTSGASSSSKDSMPSATSLALTVVVGSP